MIAARLCRTRRRFAWLPLRMWSLREPSFRFLYTPRLVWLCMVTETLTPSGWRAFDDQQ